MSFSNEHMGASAASDLVKERGPRANEPKRSDCAWSRSSFQWQSQTKNEDHARTSRSEVIVRGPVQAPMAVSNGSHKLRTRTTRELGETQFKSSQRERERAEAK